MWVSSYRPSGGSDGGNRNVEDRVTLVRTIVKVVVWLLVSGPESSSSSISSSIVLIPPLPYLSAVGHLYPASRTFWPVTLAIHRYRSANRCRWDDRAANPVASPFRKEFALSRKPHLCMHPLVVEAWGIPELLLLVPLCSSLYLFLPTSRIEARWGPPTP